MSLGNNDLVIPVFDAEPASIIAHVLSSIPYHRDLQQSFESLTSYPVHPKSRHTVVSIDQWDKCSQECCHA